MVNDFSDEYNNIPINDYNFMPSIEMNLVDSWVHIKDQLNSRSFYKLDIFKVVYNIFTPYTSQPEFDPQKVSKYIQILF